jgi:hypothetical protein
MRDPEVVLEKTFMVIPNMQFCLPIFGAHMRVSLAIKKSAQHTHNHHTQPSHHSLLLLCFRLEMWGVRFLQQGGQELHYVRYSPPKAPGSPCHACSRCCHTCGSCCCNRSIGDVDSICVNARGSCWRAPLCGEEGKGVKGERPGDVG